MSRADPAAITVADMAAHGADFVDATCPQCGSSWRAPIVMMPSKTTLAKIAELMICRTCGGADVQVAPVWPSGAFQLH